MLVVRGSLSAAPKEPLRRSSKRQRRGSMETLPSGSLRVKVYAGYDPVSGLRHYVDEVVPARLRAASGTEKARTRLLHEVDEQRKTRATVNQLLLETLDVEPTTRTRYEGIIHRRPQRREDPSLLFASLGPRQPQQTRHDPSSVPHPRPKPVTEQVPVPFRTSRRGQQLRFEPWVLGGGVVGHEVDDHADPVPVGRGDQSLRVADCAHGVDVAVTATGGTSRDPGTAGSLLATTASLPSTPSSTRSPSSAHSVHCRLPGSMPPGSEATGAPRRGSRPPMGRSIPRCAVP
jgi:hypothetical protein